jgi:hypothetical protein
MADRSGVNEITQKATPPLTKGGGPSSSGGTQPGPGRSNPPQPKGKTTGYP